MGALFSGPPNLSALRSRQSNDAAGPSSSSASLFDDLDADNPAPLPPPSPPRASLEPVADDVLRRRPGRQSTVLSLLQPEDDDAARSTELSLPRPAASKGIQVAANTASATDADEYSGMRPTRIAAAEIEAQGKAAAELTAKPPTPSQQRNLEAREKDLRDPNVQAFLKIIAEAEGATYSSLFGYVVDPDGKKRPNTFNDFSRLPSQDLASGRYQIKSETYKDMSNALGLSDFSPRTQDLMAAQLLMRHGAMGYVRKGDFDRALPLAALTWRALPQGATKGTYDGQPHRLSYRELRNRFNLYRSPDRAIWSDPPR